VHLQGEEIVGFHQTAISHLHGRMVVTQFAEQHVEGDGPGALGGQFFNQPAIDLTRPVEAVAVSKLPLRTTVMLDSSMEIKARLVAAGAGKRKADRARKSQVMRSSRSKKSSRRSRTPQTNARTKMVRMTGARLKGLNFTAPN